MLLINGGEVQSESSASVIFPLAAVFAGMLVNWPHMLNMMRMNAVEMVFLGDSIETNACRWQPYLINNWVTHGRVLTHARTHTHADISCGLCAFMPLIPDNWRPLGDLNKQMDNQAEWSELKWSQSSTGTRSRLHRRAPTSTYFDWPTHTYTHVTRIRLHALKHACVSESRSLRLWFQRVRYSSHGLQRAGEPLGACGRKNPLYVQHTDDAGAAFHAARIRHLLSLTRRIITNSCAYVINDSEAVFLGGEQHLLDCFLYPW